MPSPFQRYQNGIQPVTGISEFGAAMAKQTSEGFADVADTISQYYKNDAIGKMADEKAKGLLSRFNSYYTTLAQEPETQEYADRVLKPTIESLSKFSGLSLPKKQGALAEAELAFQDIGATMKVDEMVRGVKLKRLITEGEGALPENKASGKKPAILVSRWNPYLSGVQNLEEFRKKLAEARAAGFVGSDEEAEDQWLDSLEADLPNATFEGLSPEQADRIRGPVGDQFYTLREFLGSSRKGEENKPAKDFSEMTARQILESAAGNTAPLAETVTAPVTAPSGKTETVKLPAPPSKPLPAIKLPPLATEPAAVVAPAKAPAETKKAEPVVAPAKVEPAKAPEAVVAPAKVEPAKAPDVVVAPAKVPEETKKPEATVVAPAKVEGTPAPAPVVAPATAAVKKEEAKPSSTTTDKDISIGAYAKEVGVTYEQFEKSVVESGLPSYEYFKQLRKGAEEAGITVREYYQGITAPATESLPPPPSKTPAAEKAPESLPAPEEKPIKIATPKDRANEMIRLGAGPSRDGSVRHLIEKGDTPAKIAKKYGISQKALLDELAKEGKQWQDMKVGNTVPLMRIPQEGSADYSDEPEYPVAQVTREEAEGKLPPAPALTPEKKEEERKATLAKQFTEEEKGRQTRIWGGSQKVLQYYKELQADLETNDPEKFDFNAWGALKKTSNYAGPLASGVELASYLFPVGRVAKAGATSAKMASKADKLIEAGRKLGIDEKKLKLLKGKKDAEIVDFFRGQALKAGGEAILVDLLGDFINPDSNDDTKYAGLSEELVGKYDGGKGPQFSVQSHIEKTLEDIRQIRQYGMGLDREKLTASQKIQLGELLQTKIKELEAVSTAAWDKGRALVKTPFTYEQAKANAYGVPAVPVAEEGLPDTAPLMSQIESTGGTKDVYTKYSKEEKKERLKQFILERYKDSSGRSYLPSGFDTVYAQLHPEESLKVVQTEIGPMYWDGNSWKQPAGSGKGGMDMKDIREQRRGVFGKQTEKGWEPQEVGVGTGVYMAGIFNRSDADLAEFDKFAVHTASGLGALREMREMLKIPLHSIPIGEKRQKALGRAAVLIANLKAAIRTDVVGVGTVSNFEQTMIADATPDPSRLWSLDNKENGKIDELERRLKNGLINTASMKGLSVFIGDPTQSDKKSIEQDLRIRSNKTK